MFVSHRPTTQIIINNKPRGKIGDNCVLLQSDPLLPSLFIIEMLDYASNRDTFMLEMLRCLLIIYYSQMI